MSYCEDYIDPFDRNPCHDCGENLCICGDESDDDDHWTCLYPDKCLMPAMHCRDECHTVEDAEAYYAEILSEEQQA